jgi:hypothetical protein
LQNDIAVDDGHDAVDDLGPGQPWCGQQNCKQAREQRRENTRRKINSLYQNG